MPSVSPSDLLNRAAAAPHAFAPVEAATRPPAEAAGSHRLAAAQQERGPVLLSICVPTYHRPQLLSRALRSVGHLPPNVEIIVSDNSTANDESEQVTRAELGPQPAGQWRYYRNEPGGDVTSNWSLCLQRARGHYVLMLHDDDYLRPGALASMLATLCAVQGRHAVVQFGVDVVTISGAVLKQQRPGKTQYLAPAVALERVLTNSSFIRMPALVASREAYFAVGGLDPTQEATLDTDIWARLFARHGLYQVRASVACYTVHAGALTMGMFNEHIITLLLRIFSKAERLQLLPPRRLRIAKSRFFCQFILAGAYRALRNREWATARRILRLFRIPALRQLLTPTALVALRLRS